jgi:hypothetical protein
MLVVSQEIVYLVTNTKIHYRVHTSRPVDLILSQTNALNLTPYFFKISSNILLTNLTKKQSYSCA